MKKQILSWNKQDSCDILKKCLQEEKVFIGSTDTVLGLFAAPTKKGFELLNKLKNRQNKPYLLLISSTDSIEEHINEEVLLQIESLLRLFCPGPLTIVCKARLGTPEYLSSSEGTIAFRMPKHEGIQRLLKEIPILLSTSANKAGEPIPQTVDDINADLLDQVEYAVLSEKVNSEALPSTIIECSKEGGISLIREGAIPFKEIQKISF